MASKKILHITSELAPYFEDNPISSSVHKLAKQMFLKGNDVRIFMPRFGLINERRFQLHEVIRLSGMNFTINDLDQPLIIKVASLPGERMQVYFIDNEEYFKRKNNIYEDEQGEWFEDNGERSVFFVKGILETIKKLNWMPDIVHIHGWMGSFLPLYLKTSYLKDAFFENTKIISSIYNRGKDKIFNQNIENVLKYDKINISKLSYFKKDFSCLSIIKESLDMSDVIIKGEENLYDDLEKFFKKSKTKKFEFDSNENLDNIYNTL